MTFVEMTQRSTITTLIGLANFTESPPMKTASLTTVRGAFCTLDRVIDANGLIACKARSGVKTTSDFSTMIATLTAPLAYINLANVAKVYRGASVVCYNFSANATGVKVRFSVSEVWHSPLFFYSKLNQVAMVNSRFSGLRIRCRLADCCRDEEFSLFSSTDRFSKEFQVCATAALSR